MALEGRMSIYWNEDEGCLTGDYGDVNDFDTASATDEFGHELDWFDTHPEEDPWALVDDLQYKDEVVERLLTAIDEYLEFSTARELIKLIAETL
jgi:hypothetical protein